MSKYKNSRWEETVESLDVSDPEIYQNDEHSKYFTRLRESRPVHYVDSERVGKYWSVTRYADIRTVDTDHETFSSALGGIAIGSAEGDNDVAGVSARPFIAMDPPEHEEQRKAVAPAVAPTNLKNLESLIRTRVNSILDEVPVGTPFDWVENVSIELTSSMLATLFDFPHEQRRKLIRWSDVASSFEAISGDASINPEQRGKELMECVEAFAALWQSKAALEPESNLMSLLAHNPATKDLLQRPAELLGMLMLLIVGGNDTTRNSITGGLYALSQHPDELDKVRRDTSLIPGMVSEMIRWQTPVIHMRRTTSRATELAGVEIPEGAQVVMWYLSGNRDEAVFPEAERFVVDRANSREHLSFGFGIHRCMGNRLAEMQIRILWEELLNREVEFEVLAPPTRMSSNFIRGISELPVKISYR